MKKLVQPFEVVLKRFGAPQGYRGEVTLDVPEEPHPSGLEGPEIDKRLLAGVLGGLREFKAFCAEQDAVRVCGGSTVMHVAETMCLHLSRLGLGVVSVHMVEQGQEWTAEPAPEDHMASASPETVASLTDQLADINRRALRALHVADTGRTPATERDVADDGSHAILPGETALDAALRVLRVENERKQTKACSKCGVTMAALLEAGTGHKHAATCGGDFRSEP